MEKKKGIHLARPWRGGLFFQWALAKNGRKKQKTDCFRPAAILKRERGSIERYGRAPLPIVNGKCIYRESCREGLFVFILFLPFLCIIQFSFRAFCRRMGDTLVACILGKQREDKRCVLGECQLYIVHLFSGL